MGISTAVDVGAVARVLGIKTEFKDLRGNNIVFLPQRIGVIGQGSTLSVYATTKRRVTSAFEAGTVYGFGCPIHLAVLQLLPNNGDGVGTLPVTIYPMVDDGAGVPSAGDITPGGVPSRNAAYQVDMNGILSEAFVIEVGDNPAAVTAKMTAAIAANLNMPMIPTDNATDVGLESKWEGLSANDLVLSVIGDTDAGNTFAFTQPVGGLVNPDVQDALDQVGGVWETMLLNCLNISDTDTLDTYSTFGEGRWGALVRKPLVVFSGETEADLTTAIALPDARPTDRVNVQLVAPGSPNLPFVVAARQLARIAVLANNNPPHDYGSQDATGTDPGTDGEQWNYIQKDTAVKAGSSTVDVKDGVVNVSDVVTMFHPAGDPTPGYRYVVDIVRLQNIIFNLDLIFATDEWDGAPLIPDNQPTANRDAKKPKTAKAAVASLADGLGLQAIISDPEFTKAGTLAEIDDQNPKRLNMIVPVKLSGNTNIKSIDLQFGFFFGTPTVVA